MAAPMILGVIRAAGTQCALMLLEQGIRFGLSYAQRMVQDPAGTLTRIGDVLAWTSPTGSPQVIAGLANLSESQSRIEQVVNHIESVQLGAQHALGVMHAFSIATLGVTSFSGTLMSWRLHALEGRLKKLSETITDVDDQLDAQNKEPLATAVQKLEEFDVSPEEEVLRDASKNGQKAANTYGDLAWKEASKKGPRLAVLNYRTRCYLLALMAELQSRVLLGQLPAAIARVNGEKPRLQSIAKSTFDLVIQNQPELFLRADMASEGVTLERMTELYQQAHHAGAIAAPQVNSASQLFEHCRAKGIPSGRSWFSRRDAKQDAGQLRYLMASLEEINRIDGMRLLMSEANEKKASIPALRDHVREWWKEKVATAADAPDAVIAYAFA